MSSARLLIEGGIALWVAVPIWTPRATFSDILSPPQPAPAGRCINVRPLLASRLLSLPSHPSSHPWRVTPSHLHSALRVALQLTRPAHLIKFGCGICRPFFVISLVCGCLQLGLIEANLGLRLSIRNPARFPLLWRSVWSALTAGITFMPPGVHASSLTVCLSSDGWFGLWHWS